MFATRTLRMEWEILRWGAILALAAALAAFALQTAAGALPEQPRLLPDMQQAQPMPVEVIDENIKLTEIIALHRAGDPEAALLGWRLVQLPKETEIWRQVAMGVAQLQLGELDRAAEHLMQAEQLEPNNPVVHYYLALLRLDQARHANEWYDAVGPAVVRFAAHRPQVVAPNTKGMYELIAMQELENAIANAGNIDRTLVLAMPDHRVAVTVAPVTVGDLLPALGCENFVGQAHNMLGAMHLDRGATDQAEDHMDAAAKAGLTMVFGYRDLAVAYEGEDRYADAARAYLKGMEHDPGLVVPLQRILRNAAKALLD